MSKLAVSYGPEHGDEPVVVSTTAELDALLGEVRAAYVERWPVQLEVTLADDPVSCGLDVGLRGEVGVLFYSGDDYPDGCYSVGGASAGTPKTYYFYRNNREYPANAEVSSAEVDSAVREFMERGGVRPSAVRWQDA
ncbi:Imm1 family immunity protein [Amycolatopsis sp. cg5]|uniref:Imm1 family immunity protein n=1 Tax=Amycolatopsis sp. cg5 TaxID=3238802 RepID=UPI003524FB53